MGSNLDGMITENRPTINEVLTDMKEVRIALSGLIDKMSNILDENQQGLKDFSNEGLYEITNLAIDLQGATEQLRRVLEELETDPARFLLGEPGQREIE